jgi:hypothetical protein
MHLHQNLQGSSGVSAAFHQLQQDFFAWIGGHSTEPNEQKTQQSPGFGLRRAPQLVQ